MDELTRAQYDVIVGDGEEADEQKLAIVSNLIAYALQMMPPRESFILLHTLLTMLNKKQALPNEYMAQWQPVSRA